MMKNRKPPNQMQELILIKYLAPGFVVNLSTNELNSIFFCIVIDNEVVTLRVYTKCIEDIALRGILVMYNVR
jgi:hypothetical protein